MIYFAIIDDNTVFTHKFKKEIDNIITYEHRVDIFENRSAFLEKLNSGVQYQIVFIDIMLDDDNGIQAAKVIRQYSKDINIIFISVEQEYFLDVYDVTHTYFLVKPIKEKHLIRAIDKCISNINSNIFHISCGRKIICLDASKIAFIEGFGKHSIVHYADNSQEELVIPLKEFDEPLKLYKTFVRTHQSYIANLSYMTTYHKNKKICFYEDKQFVSISRRYAKKVDNLVLKFLRDIIV